VTEPPWEVQRARTILAICDRFHVLPSQALAESAEVLQLLKIEALARRPASD
jgi:hypothetical protein